jgi:hypothetical protein
MHELECLLKNCDSSFKFHHLNNHIQYFPHIINICMSYIVVSTTQVSKEYLKSCRSEGNDNLKEYDDNDDNTNTFLWRIGQTVPKFKPKNFRLDGLSVEEWAWFSGLKRDPVKHACMVICILQLSDQRMQNFKKVIKDGNKNGWFTDTNKSVIMVPDLNVKCDVKT